MYKLMKKGQGYLDECRKRGILQVGIVHGKGTGQLRERVHAVLKRSPDVVSFGLAPEGMGGWGVDPQAEDTNA